MTRSGRLGTIEAAVWYEYEQPKLGVEFFVAVDTAIHVIEENSIPFSPLPEEASGGSSGHVLLGLFIS